MVVVMVADVVAESNPRQVEKNQKPCRNDGVFNFNIFINMAKARKETKPKSNRKNWVKNNKRIMENDRVLKELLKK